MNILVLAAHPDDESIGMAGTIAALTDAGHAVYVATFTDGVSSRLAMKESVSFQEIEQAQHDRWVAKEGAFKVLGCVWRNPGLTLPDQAIDDSLIPRMRRAIEQLVMTLQPSVVYTHSPHDLNSDHRAVYEATLPAVRPKSGVRDVFCYQGVRMIQPFEPVAFVDITATADRKWQAIACYGDELQAELAVAKAWAVVHGYQAGVVLAEGFEVHRMIQECAA